MLGHSHAMSGAVTGTAVAIALHYPVPKAAALAGLTAGMALLPDLDKCGSGPARCCGFVSEALAWAIAKLSGGHRHATHSVIGIGMFTVLAWASATFRNTIEGKIGLALLMTIAVAGGLEALHLVRSHLADVIGIGIAAWEIWYGFGLALIPLAVLVGTTTHIVGDMLTDSGCMLAYPMSRQRFHLLPEPLAFTTGTRPELMFVDPLLTVALVVLGAWALDPAFFNAHLHALVH